MDDRIHDLEQQLTRAKERLDVAAKALAPKHKGGEWEAYRAADQEVLRLERHLAAAKGEQYAETIDFPVKWDAGAPLPHLFVNDHRVLLSFFLRNETKSFAIVEFERCIATKLGSPNDEVFVGHPLYGKGLEYYAAQEVKDSHWLKELQTINSVHSQYRADTWHDLHHYVFWFHDSSFECIARSFRVETFQESLKEVCARMMMRLFA